MRNRNRPFFHKLDLEETKWTHGRSCVKLPGRIIVTPTNFSNVSHLNLEDFSYNIFGRPSNFGSVPKAIAEDYFQYRYLTNLVSEKYQEFLDLEARHFNETTTCITYEYDLSVRKKLDSKWDTEVFKKYLEYYRRTSNRVDFKRFSLVYNMFTPVLDRHCRDSALVVDFFNAVCSHLIACEGIFMGSTMFLKLFLEHSLKIGFDPWSLMRKFQRSKESSLVEFCPVEWSLIQGKQEHLELLLKYGCPFSVSKFSAIVFNKKVDGRWWNRNGPAAIVMPGSGSPLCDHSPQSTVNLAHFTVILYLTANNGAIYEGMGDTERFYSSIRLFMRSVPYPYVSADDLLDIVGQLAPSIFPIISMSCGWYREVFPYKNDRKPRSLMHLCRCTVRKHCALPYGISKLPVSGYFKSYLNLEW